MHVIVFNHQEITLSESRKLLVEIIKQLLCQAITLKLGRNTASRYFFLNIKLS